MDDFAGDYDTLSANAPDSGEEKVGNPVVTPDEEKLVKKVLGRIKADRVHYGSAYTRMKRDQIVARRGADPAWSEKDYVANLVGRHIRQSVSALYAKNPKAVARRRPRLDFQIWDENEQTLLAAIQLTQQFQMQAAPMAQASAMGLAPPVMVPPEVQQAQALIEDFQLGMQERGLVDKLGKTLEVLFDYYMKEQKPLDFKTGMKQLVRRAKTTGCAFVEIAFQREVGQDDAIVSQIADARAQLNHIKALQREAADETGTEDDRAKAYELEVSMAALMKQQYVLLREGIVYDFPESTRVIPDKRCRNLTGFLGSRWLTLQYLYTPQEVLGTFGIDLDRGYTPYSVDGVARSDGPDLSPDVDENGNTPDHLVCVYKHFDKAAGNVYYVADGYKGLLRPAGPPEVYVEDFWPVWAFTINECDDPGQVFPNSDVTLILDMQTEYNRSRQGKREHRQAARPRFWSRKGALDDADKERLQDSKPFSVTEVNPIGEADLDKLVAAIPMPGVDPNLYDTNEIQMDINLVVGATASSVGAEANGDTATGEAIAQDSRALSGGSEVDDLDAFLTVIARASGQVMLANLSQETVQKIAGRGAVWPQLSLEDLAGEVYLETEAGSSGKPNAAQEINNWKMMLPFLIQMPGIRPEWLARESLKRLDDKLDLTDALADGLPSIVQMNSMSQPGAEDPGDTPSEQGGAGAANGAPAPTELPVGGPPGMGSNNGIGAM
jgi:hypothetical protein